MVVFEELRIALLLGESVAPLNSQALILNRVVRNGFKYNNYIFRIYRAISNVSLAES